VRALKGVGLASIRHDDVKMKVPAAA
jgi:hypothetical protein